jgi:hypothetical protein
VIVIDYKVIVIVIVNVIVMIKMMLKIVHVIEIESAIATIASFEVVM